MSTRIFFGITFSGVGFLLWFLVGLIREEIRYSRRKLMPSALRDSGREKLPLRGQKTAIQREQDAVTVRLVWWYGASTQEGEPTCGISSSYF